MLDTGCFRVLDFVRPEAIETMAAEAASLHDQTFWSVQDHNPYFSPDDESFPGIIRVARSSTVRAAINSDLLTEQSLLRKIYDADVLVHFVWECSAPRSRSTAGPTHSATAATASWSPPTICRGTSTAMSSPSRSWSRRPTKAACSSMSRTIRTPDAENYEHINILDGGRGVHELDLQPGDLQLFAGRFSFTGSPESSATPPATSGSRPMCATRTA